MWQHLGRVKQLDDEGKWLTTRRQWQSSTIQVDKSALEKEWRCNWPTEVNEELIGNFLRDETKLLLVDNSIGWRTRREMAPCRQTSQSLRRTNSTTEPEEKMLRVVTLSSPISSLRKGNSSTRSVFSLDHWSYNRPSASISMAFATTTFYSQYFHDTHPHLFPFYRIEFYHRIKPWLEMKQQCTRMKLKTDDNRWQIFQLAFVSMRLLDTFANCSMLRWMYEQFFPIGISRSAVGASIRCSPKTNTEIRVSEIQFVTDVKMLDRY